MKNHILTAAIVTLCLLVVPLRAMDDDFDDDNFKQPVEATTHQDIYALVNDDDDSSRCSVVYHDDPTFASLNSDSSLMKDIAASICPPRDVQPQQPVNWDTSWRGNSCSSWRDFGHLEDAHDDSGKSTPSTIYPDQSDDGQEDTKSKTFYLHIANPSAAKFYKTVVNKHQFSLRAWKAETAKAGDLPDIREIFKKYEGAQKLCSRMKKALKKFKAEQVVLGLGYPDKDYLNNGLFVKLTSRKEQSFKAVAKYCQKSEFIYRVFADEQALNTYLEEYAHERANETAGFLRIGSAELDLLAERLQRSQIQRDLFAANLKAVQTNDSDDDESSNSGS